MDDVQTRAHIADAFARIDRLTGDELSALRPYVAEVMARLDSGELRAAHPVDGGWAADPYVKQAILLSFRIRPNVVAQTGPGQPKSYDKVPLKFEDWAEPDFEKARLRVVPGTVVRHGAYVAPGVVLMPSFINVGAYVDAGTMVDTWATIGSCAQIGKRCHISGGAGIGGVLEPIGETPVVIEDDVFIGARSEVAEGVRVRSGAVIGMGVYLGRSTPIVDRASGEVSYGEVPENAVVVAGARTTAQQPGLSVYAAVIVKYADARTRSKTSLNELVRD